MFMEIPGEFPAGSSEEGSWRLSCVKRDFCGQIHRYFCVLSAVV